MRRKGNHPKPLKLNHIPETGPSAVPDSEPNSPHRNFSFFHPLNHKLFIMSNL